MESDLFRNRQVNPSAPAKAPRPESPLGSFLIESVESHSPSIHQEDSKYGHHIEHKHQTKTTTSVAVCNVTMSSATRDVMKTTKR